MKLKLLILSPIILNSFLYANININFPAEKVNNLGKGFAENIVKKIPDYQYYTNFDLCYKVVNVDFEKGHRFFYTDMLKGIDNAKLKDEIITICQDNLKFLREKNNTVAKGTLQ